MRCSLVLALLLACAASARADDDAETRARGHYEIGLGLYRLGDYRGALKEFAAGYELAHKPGFLLNLGQTYRRLGDLRRARVQYRQFLADAPANDRNRAETEQILAEIEAELRDHPPPPEPAPGALPPPEPAPGPPGTRPLDDAARGALIAPRPRDRGDAAGHAHAVRARRLRVAGLTLGAVGLGGLVCGTAFAVLADANARDLNRLDMTHGVYDPGKDGSYRADRIAEAVTFSVGAALAASGVILYVVGRR